MADKNYRNPNLVRKQKEQQSRRNAEYALRASRANARVANVRDAILTACENRRCVSTSGTLQDRIWHWAWSEKAHLKLDSAQRDAFKTLLLTAEEQTELLDDRQRRYVDALAHLARWSHRWLRPAQDWRPRSHNQGRQFASLARHLLCEYHVPSFMDEVWLEGVSGVRVEHSQEWFIHIGRGNNIRKADHLPFLLTKMMAHHFLQAPDELGPVQALRWGQVRGIGGGQRLARALVGSLLRRPQADEPFWLTVISFFVRHGDMLDMTQVGPMTDYIHEQRFVPLGQVPVNGTFVRMGPPQPNFSMQKRTIESLMNQTNAWHRGLAKARGIKHLAWPSCGIAGFDRIEGVIGNQKRYSVEELLTSEALAVEGRTMHHCVYSYSRSCVEGRTAIFSMKHNLGEGLERRLTIEVDPKLRLITQARGKFNKPSNELDKRIMQAWATQVGLSYGRYALQRWM